MTQFAKLNVELVRAGDVTTVSVDGEVDISTAGQLDDLLEAAWTYREAVVVDLTAVSFMDSTGLRVLLAHRAKAAAAGLPYRLTLPSAADAAVRRLFVQTRLLDVFDH